MRLLIIGLLVLGVAIPAHAIDKAGLDKRIRTLTTKFEVLQAKPDKRIPAENLRKALGIVLLDRIKGGLVFAYEGGGGLVMVKDATTGHWSPPAFLRFNEASMGFQIGGKQSFEVVLLMNTNAIHAMTESNSNFGGEASGTAGNSGAKAEGSFTDKGVMRTLVYTDASGLYGGAAFKGGNLSPDTEANVTYYGQSLTPREILFDQKGTPSEAAASLVQVIDQSSQ